MNSRYTLASLLATLACGVALAGEPSGPAPKSVALAGELSAPAPKSAPAAAAAKNAIEEIVVQARAPEPIRVAPPEIATPRFVPPPLTIAQPKDVAGLAGKQERLADASTKSKL